MERCRATHRFKFMNLTPKICGFFQYWEIWESLDAASWMRRGVPPIPLFIFFQHIQMGIRLDKVKWGLRAVSFACMLIPLLYVIAPCILTGDFSAAFLPPELRGVTASMGGAGDLNSTLAALGISAGDLKYFPHFLHVVFFNRHFLVFT